MSKSLGPSNDVIPNDEMAVAMLVQNARSRGLEWCKGKLYDHLPYEQGATKECCAIGAAVLELDTANIVIDFNGNDQDKYPKLVKPVNEMSSAYMVGAGFRCAMTK